MSTLDVVDLREFYTSPLGVVVGRILNARLRVLWPDVVGATVVGLGYATPYLSQFRPGAMRALALMPAEQGVMRWPSNRDPSSTALVESMALPLPSGSVDRLLLAHALEMAQDPMELLREAWRVIEPGGRLIVIVPTRRGWWARAEWTPFGHGRPYSRGQLNQLLRDALFSPLSWSDALHFMPSHRPAFVRSALVFERMGHALSLPFAGVHVVEATKQVYSALPARRMARLAARLKPVLIPAPAAEPRNAERVSPPPRSRPPAS